MRKNAPLISIFSLLFVLLFLAHLRNQVYAHQLSTDHLVCGYGTTPQADIIQADIRTHQTDQSFPIAAWDGYVYDNGPTDPIAPYHPSPDPGTAVLMRVISQPPAANYTPRQYFNNEATLTCTYSLSCKNSCDVPFQSGVCSDSKCNITLQGGTCARYGGLSNFTVRTGGNATSIFWDDGKPNTSLNGSPDLQSVSHTFDNPGKYDILATCGRIVCHKRYHVTCQSGGGAGSTPTPLPTSTPTPTGVYPCITPLVCSHPCGCNTSSSSYVNAAASAGAGGCSAASATSNFKGGYGSSASSTDGGACAPGLVCCLPPESTDSWFKTKDTSYHEKAPLSNSIPSNATAFNASDTGPCTTTNGTFYCHIMNMPGLLSAEGAISLGSGVANFPLWSYGNAAYNYMGEFTPDTFIQYMRARKETVTISSVSEVQTNKVNYLNGLLTITDIDNNGLQGKAPFVLLVDNGTLRFNLSQKFNPSNAAIAVIVDGSILIDPTIDEMNGVFIANDIDFAYGLNVGQFTSNQLWINGNVISMNDSNCLEKRKRADSTKPTCFFTFDFVNQYLPVWSLFTTKTFSRSSS